MSGPTGIPTPPSSESSRPRLRWHDTHPTKCPNCTRTHIVTNSPSMVQEAKASGLPDELDLVEPVSATLEGERREFFPVKCACGAEFLSFIDVTNRDRLQKTKDVFYKYSPELKHNPDFQGSSWARPIRKDVAISYEELATRAALEKNQFVREAIFRRFYERGIDLRKWLPKVEMEARLQLPPGFKLEGTKEG